jgi:sugar phosphate isomerase/epimerase
LTSNRLISLAAGAVQEFPPEQAVRAAAEAGFGAAGIWCDLDSWNGRQTAAVRRALADTGLAPLDLEVAWFHPGEAATRHDAMVDIALELGANNLLCVSSEPDITRTKQRFEHLCRRAEQGALRVVLEFLAITEVNSLAKAAEVVEDVAHPAGGILVDTLHLQRTGASAADLRELDPARLPYLQLCDATAALLDDSPAGLLEDALYLRRLPGEGELPLADMLSAVAPQLPLSLEVRSRALMERFPEDAHARAACILEATTRFLRGDERAFRE